jgi:hypothetical protein
MEAAIETDSEAFNARTAKIIAQPALPASQSPSDMSPADRRIRRHRLRNSSPIKRNRISIFLMALFFGIPLVLLVLPAIYSLLPGLAVYLSIFDGLLAFLWLGVIDSFLDRIG